LRIVFFALLAIFLVLLTVLLGGTVYGLIKQTRGGSDRNGGNREIPETATGDNMFTGLGTIRVSTIGEDPASLIISAVFPYNRNDRPFSEELISRIGDFKIITAEYLGSFTAKTLQETDSSVINKELLGRYNALLRLGQIKELYFLDFIWL
jgi:flagellar basal body-associated protein FliL